ncbi:MAG: hypothetical protein WBY94_02685 [Polyangiaceae bacterium]
MTTAALTLTHQATCAVCGRAVAGNDSDVKIVVEHVRAVFCSACFDRHPSREEWTCWKPERLRARKMLRIP